MILFCHFYDTHTLTKNFMWHFVDCHILLEWPSKVFICIIVWQRDREMWLRKSNHEQKVRLHFSLSSTISILETFFPFKSIEKSSIVFPQNVSFQSQLDCLLNLEEPRQNHALGRSDISSKVHSKVKIAYNDHGYEKF